MKYMSQNTLIGEESYIFAFDMGIQILQALKVLHRAGFVHVDMKPDNICVKELPERTDSFKRHF